MRGGGLVKLAHSNASYRFPLSLHFLFADAPNQAYLLPTPLAAALSAGYSLGFLVHRPRIHLAENTPHDVLLQRGNPHAFVAYTSVSFRDTVFVRDNASGSQASGNIRLTYNSSRAPLHTALSLPESKQPPPPCHSLAPNAAAAYAISLAGRMAPSPFDAGFRAAGRNIRRRSQVQASW
ncbi:hypothetical protein C8R44DRAFT_894240 [Mycena epipterygia]|nr:hypothetical protein C8R44DRAFT_894240 [Mycena epipterygia]